MWAVAHFAAELANGQRLKVRTVPCVIHGSVMTFQGCIPCPDPIQQTYEDLDQPAYCSSQLVGWGCSQERCHNLYCLPYPSMAGMHLEDFLAVETVVKARHIHGTCLV